MSLKMGNEKRLKIAFIHPDLGIGGAERLVLDVAGAFVKQEHEVVFLTNHFDKNHAFEELKNEEFPVRVFGDWIPRGIAGRFQALFAYIRMFYLTLWYLLFWQQDDNADLYFVDLIPMAIPILKYFNKTVIYYCHHPDLLASSHEGRIKKLYRRPIDFVEMKSTGKADVILVNSDYTASIFKKTFPEITKPIQVLYPTVAYSYLETVKKLVQKSRSINEVVPAITSVRNIVFLSLNRFHPAKKLELAILAMDELKGKVSKDLWDQIYLIMAGGYDPDSSINSQYYTQLTKLASEKELDKKVLFLKSPSDEVKAELLLECHCLIYTPTNEHFGIVPLEAMTVYKPVIACNSGGPKETVKHGVTGFLCEPNPASLSSFMQEVLDTKRAQEMGNEGQYVLQQKFSYKSFCTRLDKLLGEITK